MLKDTEEHDQASPDGKGDTGEPDVIPMAVASFLESRAAEWYRMAKVFTDDAKKDGAMRCRARAVVYEKLAERARIERWMRNSKPSG